jgi:hypothetical protein
MEKFNSEKILDATKWLDENVGIGRDSGYNTKMDNLLNYEYKNFLQKNEMLNEFFLEKDLKKLEFNKKDSDYERLLKNLSSIVYDNENNDREILLDFIERSNKDYPTAYKIMTDEFSVIESQRSTLDNIIKHYNINSAKDLYKLSNKELLEIADTLKKARKIGFVKSLYLPKSHNSSQKEGGSKKKRRKTKRRKNN